MTDRPERSLLQRDILVPAILSSLASSTRATWSATRSCSWSRSARSSRTLTRGSSASRGQRPAGSRSPSRSGCGSPSSSATSPRRSPRAAARRRPTRCARCARRPSRGCATAPPEPAAELRRGDVVVVEAGELIPGDGTVIEGIASVDESAITGESAPVIRESGGDRSAVTGGTRVLSDRIVVEITQEPGQSFLDRMIALVEGAARRKTPNEIALVDPARRPDDRLPRRRGHAAAVRASSPAPTISITVLIALLVALIPTTIGALLSAIGIAGMDRLVRRNVLALSGRAVEASGDVDVLLLDKTGTITLGNRQAAAFVPMPGVAEARPRRGGAAGLAGRRDARGPLDRRAGQAVRPARARARAARARRSSRSPRRRG